MTHTKGKWIQYAPRISGKSEEHYRTIRSGNGFYDYNEGNGFSLTGYINEADAQLIAAAPDMLEALQRINHTLNAHGKIDAGTPLHDFLYTTIKKAKGE